MDTLTTIIVSTIAGLAVLAIAGICKWLFSRKKPEPISQNVSHNQSDNVNMESTGSQNTNISGDGNTVKNSNESHDGHAVASGQGSIAIGKAQNVSINQDNPNVQMPIEELKRMIELERKDAVEEYKKANSDSEKEEPLRKITEFDKRLADLPKYAHEVHSLIISGIAVVKSIFDRSLMGSGINVEKLTEIMNALGNNDFSKADKAFAEIETYTELNTQELASIALTRGEIAEQQVRWKDAAEHYARAAQLDSKFEILIRAQKLALNMGNYPSALSFGEKAKKVAIQDHGKDSKHYASILNNLGGLYEAQKQYKKAKVLFIESLEIRKEKFGYNHPVTANALNNLASIYFSEGDYEEAEKIFKQVRKIYEEFYDEGDPVIASCINNLAGIYYEQRKYKEAEKFYLEALKIRQDGLEENHPLTATTLNNLAMVYKKQKRYKDADFHYQQALEIFRTSLGHNHPNTKEIEVNRENNKKNLT